MVCVRVDLGPSFGSFQFVRSLSWTTSAARDSVSDQGPFLFMPGIVE